MPDEVGGQPFPDGEEPENREQGAADDVFASLVLDEEFVRTAAVHEPSAEERMLAAAQARAEAEAQQLFEDGLGHHHPEGDYGPVGGYVYGDPDDERRFAREDPEYAEYAWERESRSPPLRGPIRWQRPVAWVLAVVMGVGMVAMAFAAVYRGSSGEPEESGPPPATRELGATQEAPSGGLLPVSAGSGLPVSAAESGGG